MQYHYVQCLFDSKTSSWGSYTIELCHTTSNINLCENRNGKNSFNNQNLLTKAIIYNNYLPIMPKVTSIEKFIELSTDLLANYPTTTTLSTTYTNVSKNLKINFRISSHIQTKIKQNFNSCCKFQTL